MMESYMDTAVFGPHRWMIRGSSDRIISEAQFTSKHDAEMAIRVGYAIGEEARRELARKVMEVLP